MKTPVANYLPQAARWLVWVLLFVVSLWNCTPFVQAQSFTDVWKHRMSGLSDMLYPVNEVRFPRCSTAFNQ